MKINKLRLMFLIKALLIILIAKISKFIQKNKMTLNKLLLILLLNKILCNNL
jgi:hypothetical protein